MIYPRADVNRSLPGPEQYGDRFDSLFDSIRTDLDDMQKWRYLPKARQLRDETSQHLNDTVYPMYFVGRLDAPYVLVHLNPQQGDVYSDSYRGEIFSFEDYFYIHHYFGWHHYSAESPRTHKSVFDEKQVEFIRPFNAIDFTGEKFTDLERVIDHKLQMEVVPYGSRKFSPSGFSRDLLAPHLERLMEVLSAAPREVIIFCGVVFEKILDKFIVDDHRFHLKKSDGTLAKSRFRFANLSLQYKGREFKAGLAHSFPRQGVRGALMRAYGEECASRYHYG